MAARSAEALHKQAEATMRSLQRKAEAERRKIRQHEGPPRGTCLAMCPEEERYRRQVQGRLHKSEQVPGSGDRAKRIPPEVNHSTAVKEYSRPAAGQHKPLPSELRPPRVLLNTIQHLVVHVAGVAMEGGVPGRLSQDYAFLADRFRCIRQDLAIQAAQGGDAIRVLEAHARFLAFAGYHLHRASADAFSAVLNRQQLKQTLLSLQSLYRLNGASACCRNEPMYQALLLVSFFDHPEVMETAFRLPASVVDSVPMRQARRLCVALRENRYAALVRLARKTPLLLACGLSVHLDKARREALKVIAAAYASPNTRLSLGELRRLLHLQSDDAVALLCQQHGLPREGDSIAIPRGAFRDFSPNAQVVPFAYLDAAEVASREKAVAFLLGDVQTGDIHLEELQASMATDVESKGKENRASVSLALIRNVLDGRAKVEALSAALGRDGQGAMSLGEAAVCELLLQSRDVDTALNVLRVLSEDGWSNLRRQFLNGLQAEHQACMQAQDVGRLAQHLPRLKATIDKGLLPASFQRVYDDALAILERQK